MLRKSVLLLLIVFSFLFISPKTFSQVSVKDSSISTTMIYATYGYQFLSGDLDERFGSNSAIGGGFMYKTASNWLLAVEGNYFFGSIVKNSDSILKAISTPDGYLIDENGYYGDVLFSERGYNFSAKFGKIIPILAHNPNSGILLMAGAGYMSTKIRINTIHTALPSIEGDYRKGYDKLNGGYLVSGSLGYFYMSDSRLINFYIGAEFMQLWSKSLRDYDFQTGKKDDKSYKSQFYGLKIKWMIPLFKRQPKTYYLY